MKLDITIESALDAKNISGTNGENLRYLEEMLDCNIEIYGDCILCDKEDKISFLNRIFFILKTMSMESISLTLKDIAYVYGIVLENLDEEYLSFLKQRVLVGHTVHGKPIYAKTMKQKEYLELMGKKDLVFSIGSAGTGKTYLAVCYAVSQLKKGNIERIILTRPAVEAGESLGFLPGDFKEKVDPYLRPLYDALYDLLGLEQVSAYIERGIIEIAPLAYMRGRTLDKAIIILDEAQNATVDQLKMFLTRLGMYSKMIVTGDISQVDLPNPNKSGLKVSADLLKPLREVGVIVFEKYDVVRHPLVAKIIEKYEMWNKK